MADIEESDDEIVKEPSSQASSEREAGGQHPATAGAEGADDENEKTAESSSNDEDPRIEGKKAQTSKTRRWRRAPRAASDGDDHGATTLRRRIRSAFRWAAAVVFVAVLAGGGYEGWLLFQQHQKDVAAAHALDAAKKYAVTLTTTDPNAVDQNFTDILGGATGDFKDMYTKASSRLRKVLIDNKVATQGLVVDSAVKSAAENKVEVLLFVRQSVTNSASPDPHSDITAVTMTMEKVGGRWLASQVILPAEQG